MQTSRFSSKPRRNTPSCSEREERAPAASTPLRRSQSTDSKMQLQPELNHARPLRVGNGAKLGTPEVPGGGLRRQEIYAVQKVDKLRPELESLRFANRKVFQQRRIQVQQARRAIVWQGTRNV